MIEFLFLFFFPFISPSRFFTEAETETVGTIFPAGIHFFRPVGRDGLLS